MGARRYWRRLTVLAMSGALMASMLTVVGTAALAGSGGPPVVTGLTPPAGPLDGGDTVTIAGRGLSTVKHVHFGTAVSAQITIVSARMIRVVTPPHSRGTVPVWVVAGNRSSSSQSSAAQFTYTPSPAPVNWSAPSEFDPRSMSYGYTRVSCANRAVCIADPSPLAYRAAVTPVLLRDRSWQRVLLPPTGAGSFTSDDRSACPLPVWCVVAGWSGTANSRQPTVWTWNGSKWSVSLVGAPPISVSSSWGPLVCAHGHDFCMVVDPDGVTRIYDHGQWTTPPQQFDPVSCVSDTFCLVRTTTGYATWDGTLAGTGSQPFGNYSPTISCASATFCLAIARYRLHNLQWTFDGTSWSTLQDTNVRGYSTAPSCISATRCWLISYDNDGSRSWRFDGRSWTNGGRVAGRQQASLSCWASGGCRSVDRAANIHTLSHGSWHTSQPIPRTGHPSDVSCPSDQMCIAVDQTGHALRFDGSLWHQPVSIDVHRQLRSVSCPTTHFCMATDNHGFAVRYSRDRWRKPVRFLAVDGRYGETSDVSCASPVFCMAVLQSGRAAVYRHGHWHDTPRLVAEHGDFLYGVSCPAANFCIAAGAGLSVYRGHWQAPVAGSHYFQDVSCAGTLCVAGASQVWMRNGGVLARAGAPASGSVVCATRRFCLLSSSRQGDGVAVDGASWADAHIPGDRFSAGDCTRHFCMLLLGYDRNQETHASF